MPFAFILAGIVLTIAGARRSSGDLVGLLKGDLTGSSNFGYWILSILVIGALGYVDDIRPLSRALLVLVIIVLVLANNKQNGSGGFFGQFQNAFDQITKK